MPDHVHLIFTPVDSENHKLYSLAEIMGGIKGRRRGLSMANWV
jgi:REP element-mobilizing transposase RayT